MRSCMTTPQVIQQDLGLTPEEFDKQYLAWIDKSTVQRLRTLMNGAGS